MQVISKQFHSKSNFNRIALFALFALTLSACRSASNGPSVDVSSLAWQEGMFDDSDSLMNYCDLPRSGTDSQGEVYPDKDGSVLAEQLFLRSWSNDYYLWYDEIDDTNPAGYSVLDYFDILKTNELTAEGTPKDNFHFYQDTAEYLQRVTSGVIAGYGMSVRFERNDSDVLELIVYDTEENSPASVNGINRGTRILQVDNIVIEDYVSDQFDALITALFPDSFDTQHFFTARDLGSTETRSFTMSPASISQDPVKFVSIINNDAGKVGYLVFNTFNQVAEEELYDAFTYFSNENVDELVIDLRYNGGGFLVVAAQLAYMIAGPENSNNKIFERLVYNDKYPSINPFTGQALEPFPFINSGVGFTLTDGTALPNVDIDRLFVITSGSTCSASESLINGLQGIDFDVIQIGSTTCGKPYGFNPVSNCGTTYFSVNFRGDNDKGFGEFPNGFSPSQNSSAEGVPVLGCIGEDDIDHVLGDPDETSLSTALFYMENGSCPALVTLAAASQISADSQMDEDSQITENTASTQKLLLPSATNLDDLNERLPNQPDWSRNKFVE